MVSKLLISLLLSLFLCGWVSAQPWSPVGVGTNNLVRVLHTDIPSDKMYVGGSFTFAGGNLVWYVSEWDGSNYSAVGPGFNTAVNAIESYGGDLYVAGEFTNTQDASLFVNRIARWDGSNYFELGSGANDGVNNFVYAMEEYNGDLYVGGSFTSAGGSPASKIARWDGSAWFAIGAGVNGTVYDMKEFGGVLYVAGNFTTAGGAPANYIARWDGTTWSPVGAGTNAYIHTLEIFSGKLYAGGNFALAGGAAASKIASWDGSSWAPLAGGLNAAAWTLQEYNGLLYAGGFFTIAGGSPGDYVASWDGASWSNVGDGFGNQVWCFTEWRGDIYAGGFFTNSGINTTNRVASWNAAPILDVGEVNLEGRFYQGGIRLNWTAAQNDEVLNFYIEKGSDPDSFLDLEIIEPTVSGVNYSFEDLDPLGGLNYYRIKSTGFDGSFSYSNVVKIDLGSASLDKITVYPNPSKQGKGFALRTVNVDASAIEVLVVDTKGIVMHAQFCEIIATGPNNFDIHSEKLAPGIYYIKIKAGEFNQTTKIVILN